MAEPDTELLAKPAGKQSRADSGDESEDEGEVLEESPCGRWQKRREEVEQRDVPGIDYAFLAMDTEEGVEVVWNEVQFSEKRDFRAQQDKIRQVFDNLIQLDHPNIVKFHTYWTDTKGDKPRVIFITEYMSSGSLKQFLKKTKKNNKTFQLKSWKKWCTQILSALSYLHSCDPPIIHGNLTCDTVFIQHNGLIKIGSVAPDAIHHHVKTFRKDLKNMHCIAPEYGGHDPVTTAIDIYSFGMCSLEMATLEIHGNGDSGNVTVEAIQKTIESLEDPREKDFFVRSLSCDPRCRPTARELLFHTMLFEVHSLKLLSAHCFIKNAHILAENITDETYLTRTDAIQIIAEIHHTDGREPLQWRFNQVPALELEKLLEDVKNGIYPLTALSMPQPPHSRPRAVTPEVTESVKSETPEPVDVEPRIIISMDCRVRQKEDDVATRLLTLTLRMDDKMNRQLTCEVATDDTPGELAEELVHYGFINEMDREKIATLILDNMRRDSPLVNGTSSPVGVVSA